METTTQTTTPPKVTENATPEASSTTDAASSAERSLRAESLIKTHAMASMAAGLVPIPVVDLTVMVGNQLKMVHSLGELYDVPFSEKRVRSVVMSLLGGSAPLMGVGLLSAAKIIPGVGTLIGSGSVSVLGGATTYAVGRTFVHHLETGGDLINFDMSALRDRFRREKARADDEVTTSDKPATA